MSNCDHPANIFATPSIAADVYVSAIPDPATLQFQRIRDTLRLSQGKAVMMGVRERINKYRSSGGAADLVRVEVLVPEGGRRDILERAAGLRAAERKKNAALLQKLDAALGLYGARILDNVDLERAATVSEKSRLAANALIERGDARAFVMGRKLLAEAEA
jgi:hypothetical protein